MSTSKKILTVFVGSLFAVGLTALPALADVKQIKAYKEAYPDAKPKCIWCHTVEKPKKEDGQHELNAYGKKVKALATEPGAADYKAAGPVKE